jgi:hypothetical protein
LGFAVYYNKQDIANILRATVCASEGSAGLALELVSGDDELVADPEKLLQVYRQGMRHALVSVGLAFGLEPIGQQVTYRGQSGEQPPLAGLLWAEASRD